MSVDPVRTAGEQREATRRRSVVLLGVVSVATVFVVVVALAAGRFGVRPATSTSELVLTPSPNVVLAMKDLARLETATFHMERVIELTDEQTHLFGLLSSKDQLLLVAVGDVTAGLDLDELRPEDVTEDWPNRSIHVRLPPATVFSAAIDNTRTHVVTRATDTLADRREDLEGNARAKAEAGMKEGAVEGGILPRAQKSGEREVRSLLHSLGFEHVDVEFRP